MTATLKNRLEIILLSICCFGAGLCDKIIEAVLKNRVIFVLLSLCAGVLIVAAICGTGYTIYKVVTSPWFWRLGLVFAVVFLAVRCFKRKT